MEFEKSIEFRPEVLAMRYCVPDSNKAFVNQVLLRRVRAIVQPQGIRDVAKYSRRQVATGPYRILLHNNAAFAEPITKELGEFYMLTDAAALRR